MSPSSSAPRPTVPPSWSIAPEGGVSTVARRLGGGRALRAAGVVLLLSWALALGTALVVHLVAPRTSGTAASAVALVLLTGLAVALLALADEPVRLGWRPVAAGTWPLLALPFLLTLVPLSGGLRGIAVGTFVLLLIAYALTGFTEEVIWRGVVLQLVRQHHGSATRAVVIAGLLFGAAHLTNVVFRGSPAVVVAQAVGATCFGIGYGALRLRTASLWPLMVLHLLTDLLPHVGRLPAIPVFVGQDVVLLGYALFLLRRRP